MTGSTSSGNYIKDDEQSGRKNRVIASIENIGANQNAFFNVQFSKFGQSSEEAEESTKYNMWHEAQLYNSGMVITLCSNYIDIAVAASIPETTNNSLEHGFISL